MKTTGKITILLFTLLIFGFTSLSAAPIDQGKQKRDLTGFHRISVSSGIDLFLTQKNVEEVIVEAASEDLDKIMTVVEDGTLKIYLKSNSWLGSFWKNRTRKVYVTFKQIDQLHASSGSNVDGETTFKLDKFNIDASSGSDIDVELEANSLSVNASSGSDVKIKGSAAEINIHASSGSNVKMGDLSSKKCSVEASSGSDVDVNVTEDLNANASSGSDISYTGNPTHKNIQKSSGGDVNKK